MNVPESLMQKIPEPIMTYLRTFRKYIHGSLLNEFKIKQMQQRLLSLNYSPSDTKKLIVFLTPGYDSINGGILSISSIYSETKKLKHIHGAEVIMCSVPGEPLLLKYSKFKNQNYIFRFAQILSYFQDLRYLMIHIPEYAVNEFLRNVSSAEYSRFKEIRNVHFNIMLQNINLLSSWESIKILKKFGKVTCTTAHERYSTAEIRKKLEIPLHRLSTFVSPEQYERKDYAEKEDLMIVSPDNHPRRKEVLELLHKQLPYLNINIVRNLSYEAYKKLISRAKWTLTLGEGLDGYFVETIFSGGISFAVWNADYFTEDFKALRTIYGSFNSMVRKICTDISELDTNESYTAYQKKQYDLCAKYYNYGQYVKNLELFYKGIYTHP